MRATFGLDPTSNDVTGVVTVFHGVRSRSICMQAVDRSIWSQTNSCGEYCDLHNWAVASALAPSLGLLLSAFRLGHQGRQGRGWLQLQLSVTCSRVSKWRKRCHRSWPCSCGSRHPGARRGIIVSTLAVSVLGVPLVGSAVVVVVDCGVAR